MARGLQTVAVTNLGGGVNSYAPSDGIGANEMQPQSRNVRGDATSSKPRKGYTTFADLLTGSTAGVAALGTYTRNTATNDRLIALYNNKIYKIDPDTETAWTEITTSLLTSTAEPNIFSNADNFFIMNGVDKPLMVANTTVTQPFVQPASLSAAAFLPAFGDVYGASIFCAGVPTAPNTVYISKASTSANPTYLYDFSGALTSYGDANELLFKERVTGIRSISGAAVIFTLGSAFYVDGLREIDATVTFNYNPVPGSGGAVSHKSTCVVENDVFYLTPEKEIKSIKRSLANQSSFITTSLSKKIQKFLQENVDDDLSTAWAVYDQVNKLYKLYLKQKDGAMNLIRIVADLNQVDQNGIPQWYIDDSMPFRSGVYYKGTCYLGSTVLGQVYKDEDGLADDDDAAIITVRKGKDMTANNPTSLKNFRQVKVFGQITQATTVTINAYVDDFLVSSRIVNSDDLATGSVISGIGTAPVGDYSIGSESDGDPSVTNLFEVTKELTFRQRGKKLRVDFVTDGINNDYRFDYLEFSFLPVSPLLSPILEK